MSIKAFHLRCFFALINEKNCTFITKNAARVSCVKPFTNQARCDQFLEESVSALLAILRTRNHVGYFFNIPFTNSYKITRMKVLVTLNGNGEDRHR